MVEQEGKKVSHCTRCHRRLTDPVSVARSMGAVCWAASHGDTFAADMEASDEEWARREKVLRKGGEIDFGSNWEFDRGEDRSPCGMRVSVRYLPETEEFEAYGYPFNPEVPPEVSFLIDRDLRAVYAAAVLAGPQCTAQAAWRRRELARTSRARSAA